MTINIFNRDCMDAMKEMNDDAFDLAIVDPPYGIGESNGKNHSRGVRAISKKYKIKDWDNTIPPREYFDELRRVSRFQIIWGGNYFFDYLNSSQCFLIWDKKQPFDFSLAMCELGWTSFSSPAKMFRYSVLTERGKIHPTQKPVKLYEWLLMNYAKEGDKILDTHLGSGSIAIACHNLGFDLTACELDKEYFDAAMKRLKQHQAQQRLF